jgi:hypothetical protein
MPTFDTETPIDLAINLQVGRIDVVASDRVDTIVTVTPSDRSKNADRRGVEATRVDFDGERLTVIGPKPKISWIGPNSGDSVDIRVELPTGSRLTAEVAVGGVHTRGRLGATRVKDATGSVEIDTAGDLWLRAATGGVTVGRAEGNADITAAHGQIKVGSIAGDAMLKSSYGGVRIGEAGGDIDAKLSYGDLEISRALGSVTAKTAYGSTDIGEISSGSIVIDNGFGPVSIGVRSGVPAWLDLSSKLGRVLNELASEGTPTPTEETVSVRARTSAGDITIRRAG